MYIWHLITARWSPVIFFTISMFLDGKANLSESRVYFIVLLASWLLCTTVSISYWGPLELWLKKTTYIDSLVDIEDEDPYHRKD